MSFIGISHDGFVPFASPWESQAGTIGGVNESPRSGDDFDLHQRPCTALPYQASSTIGLCCVRVRRRGIAIPCRDSWFYGFPNAPEKASLFQDDAFRCTFPEAHLSICFLPGKSRAVQNKMQRIATNRPPPMKIPSSVRQKLA